LKGVVVIVMIRINFISSLKEMDPEFVAYLQGKGFSEAEYRSWDLQRKEGWVDRYRADHTPPGKNILLLEINLSFFSLLLL
jgi:hypothetical protein